MSAQQLIDAIEQEVSRIRNIDPALLASLVAKLDALRRLQ
jgi:hypothetical protein